uniref:ADP,ATP carrier protein n=1 Tax=Paramoeba aestuarina TaxID=180227 RepID=A0A7S4U840_9EUKA
MSGAKPFLKGISATVSRDAIWGFSYTLTRKYLYSAMGVNSILTLERNNWERMGCDFFAGGVAAVLSSPFNYARNIQYASCPSEKAPSIYSILKGVWHETKGRGFLGGALLLETRMRIGWGFLRTSLGTSFGHYAFRSTQAFFDQKE